MIYAVVGVIDNPEGTSRIGWIKRDPRWTGRADSPASLERSSRLSRDWDIVECGVLKDLVGSTVVDHPNANAVRYQVLGTRVAGVQAKAARGTLTA